MVNLSEALAARGHHVQVFTTRSLDYRTWENALPSHERLAEVEIRRFASVPRRERTYRLLAYGYANYRRTRSAIYEPFILFGNGPLAPGLFWRLLAEGRRYDVIHVSALPYAHVWYTYLAAKARRVPLVITPFLHTPQPDIFDVGCYNAALRGADRVIAMTMVERGYLVERGVEPDRIAMGGVGVRHDEVTPCKRGIWRAQFGIPEDAFALLFLGRRASYKGLDTLLEAYMRLRTSHPATVLLLAGPSTPDWEALRVRYEDAPGILDYGRVSDEDKARILDACDVLVLPSTGESFGIVLIEAWMLGKPVIGARSGALAEMITEGRDGFLITPGDAEGLAARLRALADNPPLRQCLGEQGFYKAMTRYTLERVTDDMERVYAQLVEQR